MWEIRDNIGLIHSGDEDEMNKAFSCMTESIEYIMDIYDVDKETAEDLQKEWSCRWEGDLRLIQVHAIYK